MAKKNGTMLKNTLRTKKIYNLYDELKMCKIKEKLTEDEIQALKRDLLLCMLDTMYAR